MIQFLLRSECTIHWVSNPNWTPTLIETLKNMCFHICHFDYCHIMCHRNPLSFMYRRCLGCQNLVCKNLDSFHVVFTATELHPDTFSFSFFCKVVFSTEIVSENHNTIKNPRASSKFSSEIHTNKNEK